MPQDPRTWTIDKLMAEAEPRPDLITPGSTGALENARPYTFGGQVHYGGQPPPTDMRELFRPQDDEGGTALATAAPAGVAAGAFRGINTPAQKKIIRAGWRGDEAVMRRLQADPKTISTFENPYISEMGKYKQLKDAPFGQVSINPKVMRGQGMIDPLTGGRPNLKSTALHEFTHADTMDKINTMNTQELRDHNVKLISELKKTDAGLQAIKQARRTLKDVFDNTGDLPHANREYGKELAAYAAEVNMLARQKK